MAHEYTDWTIDAGASIGVKPLTRFTAKFSFFNHVNEQLGRSVFVVAHALMKYIHDVKHRIKADQIREGEWTNGVIHTELHDAINGFSIQLTPLQAETLRQSPGIGSVEADRPMPLMPPISVNVPSFLFLKTKL